MSAKEVNQRAFETSQGKAYLSRFSEREQRNIKANSWINMFLWGKVDEHLNRLSGGVQKQVVSTLSKGQEYGDFTDFIKQLIPSDEEDVPMSNIFGDDDDDW